MDKSATKPALIDTRSELSELVKRRAELSVSHCEIDDTNDA